jgi:hypothetical protein
MKNKQQAFKQAQLPSPQRQQCQLYLFFRSEKYDMMYSWIINKKNVQMITLMVGAWWANFLNPCLLEVYFHDADHYY